MKYLLTVICCVATFAIFADTVGDIEYQLPPQIAQEWAISNEIVNPKGITRIYTPKGIPRTEASEFFGVHANILCADLNDTDSLKIALTKQFPGMEIDLHILDRTEHSLLFEWIAMQEAQEKMQGFNRVFAMQNGTVILSYQTANIATRSQAQALWLPVLQEAHECP